MRVTGRRLMPPAPEQFAREPQVLAGHDRVTRGGVGKFVQTQTAEPCILAHRPPKRGNSTNRLAM